MYTQHKIKIRNKYYTVHVIKYTDTLTVNQFISEFMEILNDTYDIIPDYELIFAGLLIRYYSTFELEYGRHFTSSEEFAKHISQIGVMDELLSFIPQEIINNTYYGLIEFNFGSNNDDLLNTIYDKFHRNKDSKVVEIEAYGRKYKIEFDTKVLPEFAETMLDDFERTIHNIKKEKGDIKQAEYELLFAALFFRYFTDLDTTLEFINIIDNMSYAEKLIDIGIYPQLLKGMTSDMMQQLKQYNVNQTNEIKKITTRKKKESIDYIDGREIDNRYSKMSTDEILSILWIYLSLNKKWKSKEYIHKIQDIKHFLKGRVEKQ